MKVEVDRDVCAASGVCMMIAPQVFEPDDEGYARVVGNADLGHGAGGSARAVRRAELNCPSRAIRIRAAESGDRPGA
jgi:ferredoxin